MARKKQTVKSTETVPSATGVGLKICRNKHWRYISAYHGKWLSLPIELLDCIALQNWQHPEPRPIEPGVLYDVIKIRKYVDVAAEEAVRAANGTATSITRTNRDYTSLTGDPGTQLSKARVLKIRQKACKSLYAAYELDEIGASVASMASTSTLEDLAQHILRSDAQDLHAKYMHFFHEKIPSRAMSEHTTLEPLDDLLKRLPWEAQLAPLRTRGGVQLYKGEYAGAITDYSSALRLSAELNRSHRPAEQSLGTTERHAYPSATTPPPTKPEDQPSSVELQLLFSRGCAYLRSALEGIDKALVNTQRAEGENPSVDVSTQQSSVDARKHVKSNAKRAQKDLLAFLSRLHYTPGTSDQARNDSADGKAEVLQLTDAGNLDESDRSSNALAALVESVTSKLQPSPVVNVGMLFAEKAPIELSKRLLSDSCATTSSDSLLGTGSATGDECVTYHPLFGEVVHHLLLAHALLQTSPTELRRHAVTAARLLGIADGASIFQIGRLTARAEWAEVLRITNDWIGLGKPWQELVPFRPFKRSNGAGPSSRPAQKLLRAGDHTEQGPAKSANLSSNAMLDALADERVFDEETFERALKATQASKVQSSSTSSSIESKQAASRTEGDTAGRESSAVQKQSHNELDLSTMEPTFSQMAQLVARWILEAPQSIGTSRKRRAHPKKQPENDAGAASLTDSATSLTMSQLGESG